MVIKTHCPRMPESCVNTSVKVLCALFVSAVLLAVAGVYESQGARIKLDAIETGRATPGSRIVFSPGELNAWVTDAAKTRVPQGASNLRLVLGAGSATGYADLDFVRLHQAATGESAGW